MSLLPKNEKVERSISKNFDVWVMGSPGVGKTTFATTFPNPLLINTDGNFKQFDIPAVMVPKDFFKLENGQTIHAFDYVELIINEAIADSKNGYETIIIDLLEDIVKMCEKKVARENGKELIQDVPWGKGHKLVADKIESLITRCHESSKHFVFLSHSINRGTKNSLGQDITEIVPKQMKDEMIQTIAGRVELMANLEVHEIPLLNDDGTAKLDAHGQLEKQAIRILMFEKSERLPSVVKRFNSVENYTLADYQSLVQIIKTKKVGEN